MRNKCNQSYTQRARQAAVSLSINLERELTLRDLLQIFRRWRVTVFAVTGLCFVLAILLCILTTRRYQATGTIQVQKESSDGLDLDSLTGSAVLKDAWTRTLTFKRKPASCSRTNSLCGPFAELKLEDTPEFRPSPAR